MTYSEVIKNSYHKILPQRKKYGKHDVQILLKRGFNLKEARFIILCTASYFDTDWTKLLSKSAKDFELNFLAK